MGTYLTTADCTADFAMILSPREGESAPPMTDMAA